MSQKIKISESDILNHVKTVVKEELDSETSDPNSIVNRGPSGDGAKLTLARDAQGKFYIIKDAYTDNPVVVYQEK